MIIATIHYVCEGCGKISFVVNTEMLLNSEIIAAHVEWSYVDELLVCEKCFKKLSKPESPVPERYLEAALYLKERILERRQQKITEAHIKAWCNDVRLMVEQDKRAVNDIIALIKECHDMEPRPGTGFTWRDNIRSMSKLRQRWNEGKIFIGMNSGATARHNGYGRKNVSNEELRRQMQHDAETL